jgi:hypothetical protein
MTLSDNRLKEASNAVKLKICDSLSILENKFGIKFDFKINDNGRDIVFSSHDNYKLEAYQTHGKIVFKPVLNDSENEFVLNSQDFKFSIPNAIKSFFIVSFDYDFNITSIRFSSLKRLQSGIARITVLFDNDFELNDIDYYSTNNSSFNKKGDSLLSFHEESLLFSLLNNDSEEIKNLLPEYYIPSAYDFNTEEFADRLKVYSMLTL